MRSKILILLILSLSVLSGALPSALAAPGYTFSVVPQYNVVQLHTEWAPVLERISHETGVPLELVLTPSLPMFERTVLLAEQKIKFQPQFFTNHGNVYRHILSGSIVAGGGVIHTFNDEKPEVREQLRVLYQAPSTASHPVIVHPRVPEQVREAVKAAFLAMQKDAAGAALLQKIRLSQPVAAHYATDYLPLIKLGLEK